MTTFYPEGYAYLRLPLAPDVLPMDVHDAMNLNPALDSLVWVTEDQPGVLKPTVLHLVGRRDAIELTEILLTGHNLVQLR